MNDIRAAVVQFEHQPGDKEANLNTIRRFVGEAARKRVHIAIFPECCVTGYWHLRHLDLEELRALAEPVPQGATTQALIQLAQDSGMAIGAGLVEMTDQTMYNTYVVTMPDGTWAKHRKLHTFISPHLSSGSEYTVFDSPFGCRFGILTCYDNNLGENVRITAMKGAEVLLAPHQTGGCGLADPLTMGLVSRELWDNRHADPEAIERELRGTKGRAWLMRWLPTRAHDNAIFLLFSNGIGIDDDEIRTGNAMIIDPYGRIVAETWKAGDDMVVADLDASLTERALGKRWIRTRRPELYQSLACPTGLEEDIRKVRFEGQDE